MYLKSIPVIVTAPYRYRIEPYYTCKFALAVTARGTDPTLGVQVLKSKVSMPNHRYTTSGQCILHFGLPKIDGYNWDSPKIRGPDIDPQEIVLLLYGHPQKDPN